MKKLITNSLFSLSKTSFPLSSSLFSFYSPSPLVSSSSSLLLNHSFPIYGKRTLSTTGSPSKDAQLRNSAPDAVFMVQGASRGIGLEVVKQLLHRTKGRIIATCRNPQKAEELKDLQSKNHERVIVLPLDATNEQSIHQVVHSLNENQIKSVDVLLNMSGILHEKTSDGDNIMPEKSLQEINSSWMMKNFEINSVGPLLVIKGLANHLTQSKIPSQQSQSHQPTSSLLKVIVNMSAQVGSIGDNSIGGWYSYRASKAALNMLTKTVAIERKKHGNIIVAYHPGTVKTDLSAPFHHNLKPGKLIEVDNAAKDLLDLVDKFDNLHDSGKFFSYKHLELPW